MQNGTKEWLVRTRGGDILGPFTQNELVEEMSRGSFRAEDEISPAQGPWVSASVLAHRDRDEFTRTSTRSQTIPTQSQPVTPRSSGQTELTPTPDLLAGRRPRLGIPLPKLGPLPAASQVHRPWAVLAIAISVITVLWGTVFLMRPFPSSTPNFSVLQPPSSDTPGLREVYARIRAGDNQTALKQLTQLHERSAGKTDLEYLIPYAALLITERESLGRARKLLDQVLVSDSPAPLKAKAHLWLGYLSLSQDEGDMGESHFLEALQLNPKDIAARFNLGRAYLKQDKLAQALDFLQLAELEAPDLWLIHLYKGHVRLQMGSMDEAKGSFKSAVHLAPDRWITHLSYALFLMSAREGDSAQAQVRRMLARDPNYERDAPTPFGFFQERTNYNEYLNSFNAVMDKSPTEERELGRLYINYLSRGPVGSEGRRLETMAEKGGLHARVIGLKVLLDREAPNEELKPAVQRLPQNLGGFGYYGYVLRAEANLRLGHLDEAQQDLQNAMAIEPKAASVHLALARVLKRGQRAVDAQTEIKTLLSYHPDYIPAIVFPQNQ